jgi:ActR/RegA family two-component response regulator
MHRSAAVLCQDPSALQTLRTVLAQMEIEPVMCHSQPEAMEQILSNRCTALVVDFDLPGAADVAKLAGLLDASQRPAVMAMTGIWPGSGQAFQSGANRILYKPLDPSQIRDAFDSASKTARREGRNAPRYKVTSVVWLELETGTLPAVAVNLSEHGMAIRATERVRLQSSVSFRCTLPGCVQLHGHADVIWSDAEGHAGMFFSRMSLSAQKHLRDWLRQRAKMAGKMVSGEMASGKTMSAKNDRRKISRAGESGAKELAAHGSIRDLLQPKDSQLRIAAK